MKITMQIKLQPTKEETVLLDFTMQEYISLVNDILDYAIASDIMPKLTSKTMIAPLPSALKAQCYMDAKSIYGNTLKHKSRMPEVFGDRILAHGTICSAMGRGDGSPLWRGLPTLRQKCTQFNHSPRIPRF